MSEKQILFRDHARAKIYAGTQKLFDAVRVTLGPKSKCVLIEQSFGKPLVCNDGVTIAKEFTVSDPEENLGVQVIRDAAEQTGSEVGDGTTTSTILAYAIFREGLRNVTAGASAIDVKRGLEHGLKLAVKEIQRLSRPVESKLETAQVAAIAAHNDPSIGELVAEAIEKVGQDGAISVEEARGTETSLEVVEGMQLDRGYLSPYFVNEAAQMEVVLEKPVILLCEQKLGSLTDILPLLEEISQNRTPLLVIAEDVTGEALAAMVVNNLRGILVCAAVKAPGFGDRRKAIMEDLAIMTGGQFITSDLGLSLDKTNLESLGKAQRVIIDKDTTTIIGGAGARAKIEARCTELRQHILASTSDYEKEKLEERLAKLSGGVAVIRAGAATEAELKNLKEALDDAIHATKAATAEGIVPGCGLALLRAIAVLEAEESKFQGDELTGIRILKRALEEPTRQIAINSDADDGVVVFQMRAGEGNFGFDGSDGSYGDLIAKGIIDPTKVVRIGLENAVSVASTLLLTEATLTNVPEKKKDANNLAGAGMPPMGGF